MQYDLNIASPDIYIAFYKGTLDWIQWDAKMYHCSFAKYCVNGENINIITRSLLYLFAL